MRLALLIYLVSIGSSVSAQSFEIDPPHPVLTGERIGIRLTQIPPARNVTITAERAMAAATPNKPSVLYRSKAVFASPNSDLDLATAKPESGSYRHADIRGLFWSMTPIDGADTADLPPMHVRLTATADGKVFATTTIEFVDALPDIKVESVEGFPGAVFASLSGKAKRPAVIVLGGSEGGSQIAREWSPRLASRGFAVLGLPYYSPAQGYSGTRELPDLPAAFADIEVDRLNVAFNWLKSRDDVDASRVALFGGSKGAELALIAASHCPWITSVVAAVPSDVVWEGWGPGIEPGTRSSFSLHGKPLPFVPYQNFERELLGYSMGQDVRLRRPQDDGRTANPAAAVRARIRVENFKGPLMVIGGQDDQIWASGMMAQNIAERRAEAGLETVALIFSDAGHWLTGSGWLPTTQYNAGPSKVGGTPEGNAHAQAHAFPQTIVFLKRTLGLR